MVVKSEKRGTIRKIVFKNFLTYEDETIEPEPNLNVIIGCNGTGKSTIMCGIYLACGGNPKDLGRSERFGDYVKHGKESGSVELTVCTRDAGVCSVLKIVVSKPNSAEFYIDDCKHNVEGMRRFSRKNKFQIDNPCAFLAQDKVKSFAEQSAQELLINTEKAVSPILFAKHNELMASRNNGHNVVQLCDQLEATVKRTKDEIAKLEDLVKNYQNRVVMDKRISLLEKKQAMMLYDEMKRLYDECGERRKQRRNELKTAEDQLAPIEQEVKQAERDQKDRLNKIRKSKLIQRDEKIQRVHRCHRDAADVRDTIRQITDIYAELKAEIDKIEARKRRIETTKTEIAMLKTHLDGCNANDDNLKQQMNEIDKQYDAVCRQISSFDVELRTCASNREQLREKIYRIEMRERESERFESNKLQQLFAQNPRAIDAWRWYCDNRDQFSAPVYIAAMSMRLISQEAVTYLMTAIAVRDLQMFIFASTADEQRLQAQCKIQRWKINSTVITASDIQNNTNARTLPVLLRQYGFQGFASDLFEAPDSVVAYLNSVSQLNTVPIGGEEVDRNFNKIADNPEITKQYRLYLTKTERIFFKYSRYSSDMITKREDLRQQRPLLWYNDCDQKQYGNGYVDKDGEKRQLSILEQQSNELNGKKMEHTRQQNQLRVEKSNLQQQLGGRRRIENDINNKTQRLDRLLQEGTNVDAIRRRIVTQVAALVDKAYNTVEKVTDRLQNTTSELDQIAIDSLRYEQMIRRSRHRRHEYHRRKAELVDLSTEVRNTDNEYNQLVEQMRDRIANTLRVVEFDTLNTKSMNDETRQRYNEMWKQFKDENIPVELAEVKLQLAREQARLQAASSEGNEQHIVRYETCKKELAIAERQLIEERERKETWRENLQKEIDEWREHLGRLILRLNENYSTAFRLLGGGTAGEIRLQPGSDELDTAKYGIDIMVKFREHEPLRRLTAKVQSGGERSVSTMLYLMALQQISALPFCCVDEINQGMDPSNERRVFNMMVDLLSGNMARTQYFMLTPKLLPELNFNDRVNVLVVHNGPSMITGEQFDFEKIIAAAKAARHH